MLESLLRLSNLYWLGESYRPWLVLSDERAELETVAALRGQFALAAASDQRIVLARDRLGLNKLFFAIHRGGRIVAANYLVDLVEQGVPPEAVFSVPAGTVAQLDLRRRRVTLSRYFRPQVDESTDCTLNQAGAELRTHLGAWFSRLARAFGPRRIVVCLSGGLDSGLIAALARQHFASVTAYTFSYSANGDGLSEDARCGRRLAEELDIPWRLASATSDDALASLDAALIGGQDWREFNVHCAIVNELLARAIQRDLAPSRLDPVLILTGDLMNELVADYEPVTYGERSYYPLPRLPRGPLRATLVRGLDAGDREVGVFGRHGLEVIQPYGLFADALLQIPSRLLRAPDAKQRLAAAIAGDLLPEWILRRPKVRAQVGGRSGRSGVLAWAVDGGRDAAWLRTAFRRHLGIANDGFLDGFIRAGAYRTLRAFPTRVGPNGYLAA